MNEEINGWYFERNDRGIWLVAENGTQVGPFTRTAAARHYAQEFPAPKPVKRATKKDGDDVGA